MTETVAIIGTGPVGSLAALGFAHRGYKVTLFDLRPDPRTTEDTKLRSINLAVSDRGISAMKYVDGNMAKRSLSEIIPMYGRMIHDLGGHQQSQKYGLHGEHINSIDRAKLNKSLVNEIELFNKNSSNEITFNFKCKFLNMHLLKDKDCVQVEYLDKNSKRSYANFDFIIGADGCYSKVRSALMKYTRMDYQQVYIDMCYLELSIPAGPNSSFLIDANHLHIWPRKDFMLIALPNMGGSFTCTVFGPWKLMESLNTEEKVKSFFSTNFSDAVPLIGEDHIVEAFLHNPRNALMHVTCSTYHNTDKCILIGDSAHSMVPFYGQGMNCGFEDIRVLLQMLEKNDGNRAVTFEEYSTTRHQNLVAILKLALDNFYEMSTKVQSPLFLLRKGVDNVLGRLFPSHWIPLYTMVSFRADIPYSVCIETENRQAKVVKYGSYSILLGITVALLKHFIQRAGK